MIKAAIMTALLAFSAFGQTYRYVATTGDVVLSGAGTKFTIQQTASKTKAIQLEAAVVYCSVACDVTQTQNGTAATATAGTVTGISPLGPPSVATVWTGSNVGSGTAASGILHLAAGEKITIDLSKVAIPTGSTAYNYSFVISSITGNTNITLYWSEQ